jgi:sporulation protein YhbH
MSTFRHHKSIADRSATDRSRHKQKIDKALKEGIRNIVAEESIIGQAGKKKIRIPVRGIREYQFIYGDNSKKVASAPGKDIHRGQKIAEDKDGQNAAGNKPGNKPGEEFYDVEITLEELAEYLFSDLELPDLDKKKFKFLSSDTFKRKGVRTKGIRARLSKKETLKQKIRRKKMSQKAGTYNEEEEERFPFHEDDLRYKHFKVKETEISSAAIFFIMDISGSMSTEKKYIARSFFFLLYQFLRHKYDNVEVVFIAHTTTAKEVNENDFFSLAPSGGTYISPALDLALEIIEKRYHPSNWNIYSFHCSDGDNWSDDEKKALKASQKLKQVSQLYSFCEIDPNGESSQWRQGNNSRTYDLYQAMVDKKFKLIRMINSSEIWPAFKKLFGGRSA